MIYNTNPTPQRVPGSPIYAIQPHDLYNPGMAGIWDDLVSATKKAVGGTVGERLKKELKDQIDSAQAKIEQKLGNFLTSNQALREYKGRAQAQQNSDKSEVRSRATAIVGKADGLLNQYESIRTAALDTAAQLAQLKTNLDHSEVFKFTNPLEAGSRIIELFNQNKSQILNASAAAATLVKRIDTHLKDVAGIRSDVESLESYSQGKGFGAISEKIGGGLTGTLKPVAWAAGIGLAAYLLLPALMRRRA